MGVLKKEERPSDFQSLTAMSPNPSSQTDGSKAPAFLAPRLAATPVRQSEPISTPTPRREFPSTPINATNYRTPGTTNLIADLPRQTDEWDNEASSNPTAAAGQGPSLESAHHAALPNDTAQFIKNPYMRSALPSTTYASESRAPNGSNISQANSRSTTPLSLHTESATPTEKSLAHQQLPHSLPQDIHIPSPPATVAINTPVSLAQTPLSNQGTSAVVERRAMEHIEYGNSLAMRGAGHAAKQEFLQALHIVAESNDAQRQSRQSTTSLASGLLALEEAADFLGDMQMQDRNLATMIGSHRSRVLSEQEARSLSPIQAMQAYYYFAEQRFSDAGGASPTASLALYSLGKLLLSPTQPSNGGHPIDQTKAMVMFRSSLATDSTNHRSANELGVLMARNGRFQQSKELLLSSLRNQPTQEAWKNLAKVHENLGETALASLARSEETALSHSNQLAANQQKARWVTSQTFEQQAAQSQAFAPSAQPVPRVADASSETPSDSKKFKLFSNLKKLF